MNTNNTNKNAENDVATVPDVKIVLNGGSDVLESATVPFRWFFSDAIIEKQPTHIFIRDLDEEADLRDYYGGERMVTKVARGSDFIQFNSPGRHHLTFLVMKLDMKLGTSSKKEVLQHFLTRKMTHTYSAYFPAFEDDIRCIAGEDLTVEIPTEFFATKPKSAIGRLFFNWVNRWHPTPPRDECQFRARIPWAFTTQPILLLLWAILLYGIIAPVLSLYLILGRLAVPFLGFRPEPLLKSFPQLWKFIPELSSDDFALRMYGSGSYRVWIPAHENGGPVYMKITGSEVLLSALGGFFAGSALYLALNLDFWAFSFLGCGGTWFAILYLLIEDRLEQRPWFKGLKRFLARFKSSAGATALAEKKARKEAKRLEKEQKAAQEPLLYFEWLKAECHVSQTPPRVDVKTLPPAFKAPHIHRFRVAFWDIKRRICRPYAK